MSERREGGLNPGSEVLGLERGRYTSRDVKSTRFEGRPEAHYGKD